MPFAAEAQGFGTCDLEQAVVSVGFQNKSIYIYIVCIYIYVHITCIYIYNYYMYIYIYIMGK